MFNINVARNIVLWWVVVALVALSVDQTYVAVDLIVGGLLLASVFAPFVFVQNKKKALNLLDLPASFRTHLDGYNFVDEKFENAARFVIAMTPDEFIRFCRVMVELRYNADQAGMTKVSEYIRTKRAPK